MSHELKTPLTAIAGYAEALREGAVGADEAAEILAVEAERLDRLVGDLLDLARMNRTDFSVRNDRHRPGRGGGRRRTPLPAAGRCVRSLAGRGLGTARRRPSADADRVLQVVSNLVENALRLTPPGGEVRVVAMPGQLRVEDTGPGPPGGGAAARVRALLPALALRRRAAGRHRARPGDREGAHPGDGRERRGGERPRPPDRLHGVGVEGSGRHPRACLSSPRRRPRRPRGDRRAAAPHADLQLGDALRADRRARRA